jgi:uncharacterized protein (TIGR03437 family)
MNFRKTLVSAMIGAAATVCVAQPNRILSKIDSSKRYVLPGRVHPLATAANDAGEVDSSFPLPNLTMMLQPTAAQQSRLQQLLQDQQNPQSPSYHQWLTPEQYAGQFGVSASDAAQIAQWLEGQGFTVDPVSRSRTFLTFRGTAGQVQNAFGTAIHRYQVNGQMHYANATDPTIPAALSPLVAGIRGLDDFRPKPKMVKARPNWTIGRSEYVLAPDDFATIYDIAPMYSAGTNGTGQKIAIVGQSTISSSDIKHFWTTFGLTSVNLTQIQVPRENPGLSQGDVDESSLDIEWAGAVARDATIVYVYSYDVWDSATYAVDNAVAPVLSMTYGACEMYDLADLPTYRQLVQQANAEGMTWLAAAGDQGSTDCDGGNTVAEGGLAVDAPGSIPEVTAMGGTSLSGASSYWNASNTSTDASAKGYVPETAWNDTAVSLAQGGGIAATGGGASVYFPQPSWQTSAGVPNDGWRHVPDISLNAGVYEVPYYVYCSVCMDTEGGVEYVGGTSAATPTMAGVVALLNQYLKTNGLGNINPTIYKLFQTAPSAFHNNITGNNIEPCAYGSPGCVNGEEGFTANGSGYSSVVGFGSVDATQFIQQWNSAVQTGPVVVASLDQNPVFQGNAENCGNTNTWNFQLTLSEEAGIATSVTGFSINGTDYSSQIAAIFGGSALGARQSISGCMSLSSVNAPANETLAFSGPFGTTSLAISFQGPQTQLAVGGASNAASGQQTYAPGMIMSLYGTALGTLSQAASTIPLPEYMAGFEAEICPVNCQTAVDAYPVPLYYVGPNQVNLQIPYEVSGSVDLSLGNPYQSIDYFFTVTPIAPGIFTTEDGSGNVTPPQTLSPGQTGTVYVTGVGAVSPAVADGSAPTGSQVPKPRSALTVTVGGVTAQTSYDGIPDWSVGVLQINFTIPSNAPTGRQPVVVTVGTVSSPPAYVTIQ